MDSCTDPTRDVFLKRFARFLVCFISLCVIGCGAQRPIPAAGLQLWLKADEGVRSHDSTVSRWEDQSGNGNDAIQQTAYRQPHLRRNALNGKPVLHFDGFDDRLGLTGSNPMHQISLFIVVKLDHFDRGLPLEVIVFGDADASGHKWGVTMGSRFTRYSPDSLIVFTGTPGYVFASGPGCNAFGVWHVLSVITDSDIWRTAVRANGVDARVTHTPANLSVSVPLGNPAGAGLGGIAGVDWSDGRTATACDIAEVIVYDSVLPDSINRSVESYLAMKYRIPADSGAQK